MSARRMLSKGEVNRQVRRTNADTHRGTSSVEASGTPSGRRNIFTCKNFKSNCTIFLNFFCDPTAVPGILQRREHAMGTQLGVTGR